MEWVYVENGLPELGVKVQFVSENKTMTGMITKGFVGKKDWVPVWFSEGKMIFNVMKWRLME